MLDLAIDFWTDPDARLLTGYRRPEDAVRRRSGVDDHGASLFQKVFLNNPPELAWDVPDVGEQKGRGQLFVAAYTAYRNPRAHRAPSGWEREWLDEFLMLNHLFRLAATADDVK